MKIFIDSGIEVAVDQVLLGCEACGARQLVLASEGAAWVSSHYEPRMYRALVTMPGADSPVWVTAST